MGRPERIGDMAVIFRPRILAGDKKGEGRAGGFSFEQARQGLHPVAFLALGGDRALSRFSPVEFRLHKTEIDFQSRRTPVDNAADAGAMGFAEGGDAEEVAEGV